MKYGFYPGCSYHSAAGYTESVDSVCRVLGIELEEIDDWNCCGATAFFSSDELNGLALAGRVFALAQACGIREIVTVCNACYTTLRKAGRMLAHYPDRLAEVNGRLAHEGLKLDRDIPVRHLLDVFVNDVVEEVWSKERVKGTLSLSVAGYYGCQLTRPWGDLDDPGHPSIMEDFIERLGFQSVSHSARTLCCGASLAVPYEDECSPLISRIIGEARAKGADIITTLCPLCQFNLDVGQKDSLRRPVPVPYFTQLAGLALGLEPRELGLDKLLVPMTDL